MNISLCPSKVYIFPLEEATVRQFYRISSILPVLPILILKSIEIQLNYIKETS